MINALSSRLRRTARSHRRSDHERGAAIVEFALVSIVLVVIVLGLIEGGLMVRASNAIRNAADDAARRGSIAGTSASADYEILQQLRARGADSAARINHVVIYRADFSSDEPSAPCKAGTPVAGECNVYQESDFDLPPASFDCSDSTLDGSWCPSTRSPGTGFGYLGIWIDATHVAVVGGVDLDLTAESILPLEASTGVS